MTYTSLTAESAIAAVAVSRNVGIVTRRVAPESTSWWWTSPDVYVGLTVVSTPPASATAWKMTPYSGQLGAIMATTSPFASPRSNQPLACRRTASSNSAYVIVRPVAPSMKAGLPANRPACSSVYGVNGDGRKTDRGQRTGEGHVPLLLYESRHRSWHRGARWRW